jgi:hypothetical protein
VRDWSAVVDARLSALGLDGRKEAQIRAELAGHLADAYADAMRRGCDDEDAAARALAQVPDWTNLADVIRRANQEGDPMTRDARTLLVPGMAALCGASAVVLGLLRFVPPSVWTDDRMAVRLLVPALWLVCYLALGALGASLSRRAGGGVAARFVAGIFPLALHLLIFATVVVAAVFENSRFPEPLQINFQLRAALAFLVVPGIALAVGALPFLRGKTGTRVSA